MTTLVCKDNKTSPDVDGTTATSNNTPLTYLTSTRTTLRQCGALLRKAASNELARGSAQTAEALIAVAIELEDEANGQNPRL